MTEGAHDAHCVRAGVRCSDFCFGRSIAVDVRCEFVLETTIGSVCDAKTEIRTPDPSLIRFPRSILFVPMPASNSGRATDGRKKFREAAKYAA